MKYSVIYESRTGNTQKIAQAVFDSLPGEDKDIEQLDDTTNPEQAEILFIGFWIDRGTCPAEMKEFLSRLHNKKAAFFVTCGMGASQSYYQELESRVRALLPGDNTCLGFFICQGKMPIQVRKRYEAGLKEKPGDKQLSMLLHNFDAAMLHPDEQDMQKAEAFTREILGMSGKS